MVRKRIAFCLALLVLVGCVPPRYADLRTIDGLPILASILFLRNEAAQWKYENAKTFSFLNSSSHMIDNKNERAYHVPI